MYPPRIRSLLPTVSPQRRLLTSTSSHLSASQSPGKDKDKDPSLSEGQDPTTSQGHVTEPNQRHPQDPQSQAARAGFEARHGPEGNTTPFDAARHEKGFGKGWFRPPRDLSGNWEGIGFAEQVGSASASLGVGMGRSGGGGEQAETSGGEGGGVGGEDKARAPGVIPTLKQALGIGTKAGEVKQNSGGGQGVTGTGAVPPSSSSGPTPGSRGLHTSSVLGSDGDEAREVTKERDGDRDKHQSLQKEGSGERTRGENAGEDLPSNGRVRTALDGHDTAHGGSGYGGEEAERFNA